MRAASAAALRKTSQMPRGRGQTREVTLLYVCT